MKYIDRGFSIAIAAALFAQSHAEAQGPRPQLRPIGAPSAVDRYQTTPARSWRETAYQNAQPVRQVAMQAPGGGMQLPSGNLFSPDTAPIPSPSLPSNGLPSNGLPSNGLPSNGLPGNGFPSGGLPNPLPGNPNLTPPPVAPSTPPPIAPATPPPRTLPAQPVVVPTQQPFVPAQPAITNNDYAPMIQPQLDSGYATMANCSCISPPSKYRAASGIGCGAPVGYVAPQSYVAAPQIQPIAAPQSPPPQVFVAPPVEIPAPAVLPAETIAIPPIPLASAPFRPLVTFGQERNPVQVGQGIVGQPVAFVPGQRIRNFIRYLLP